MCIAILAKAGVKLPDQVLRSSFYTNQHGSGLAFVRSGKVEIKKGFFDSENWIKAYHNAFEDVGATSPIILHARIASLGKINRDNCHPFPIKNGALIHNGVLWSSTFGNGRQAEKSDTREFAERLHNVLTYDDITEDKTTIEKAIGYNKMVLLFNTGKYVILNEHNGHWDVNGDVWYSAHTYKNANAPASKTSEYMMS
jgi:hypothetical protein